jgi:hypothetical protein
LPAADASTPTAGDVVAEDAWNGYQSPSGPAVRRAWSSNAITAVASAAEEAAAEQSEGQKPDADAASGGSGGDSPPGMRGGPRKTANARAMEAEGGGSLSESAAAAEGLRREADALAASSQQNRSELAAGSQPERNSWRDVDCSTRAAAAPACTLPPRNGTAHADAQRANSAGAPAKQGHNGRNGKPGRRGSGGKLARVESDEPRLRLDHNDSVRFREGELARVPVAKLAAQPGAVSAGEQARMCEPIVEGDASMERLSETSVAGGGSAGTERLSGPCAVGRGDGGTARCSPAAQRGADAAPAAAAAARKLSTNGRFSPPVAHGPPPSAALMDGSFEAVALRGSTGGAQGAFDAAVSSEGHSAVGQHTAMADAAAAALTSSSHRDDGAPAAAASAPPPRPRGASLSARADDAAATAPALPSSPIATKAHVSDAEQHDAMHLPAVRLPGSPGGGGASSCSSSLSSRASAHDEAARAEYASSHGGSVDSTARSPLNARKVAAAQRGSTSAVASAASPPDPSQASAAAPRSSEDRATAAQGRGPPRTYGFDAAGKRQSTSARGAALGGVRLNMRVVGDRVHVTLRPVVRPRSSPGTYRGSLSFP